MTRDKKGQWYSAPAAKRKAKPKNLTLTPEAHEALAALTSRPGGDSAAQEASAAICERAERLGVWKRREGV
jgi:hypothetical protein